MWSRTIHNEIDCNTLEYTHTLLNLCVSIGLLKWFSGEESFCQCRSHRRHGFNPWVGKIPWRRKWQLTPVFLPGKFHGQRSLVGYSPWGHQESDMTERLPLIHLVYLLFCWKFWVNFLLLLYGRRILGTSDCHWLTSPDLLRFISTILLHVFCLSHIFCVFLFICLYLN